MVEVVPSLILLLTSTAFLSLIVDPLLGKNRRRPISASIAIIALSAAIGIASYQAIALIAGAKPVVTGGMLSNDLMASFFTIVVSVVALFVALSSYDYMSEDRNISAYYSLLLFATLGMILLAFATDLLLIIIAWELMSLPTYILAGFLKRDPSSSEAAIKYFILGALSSALILYGVSLIFGLSGSTNLSVLVESLMNIDPQKHLLAIAALTLLIAGFGLKLSIVPFHMWVPDTYEGAPTPIAALLSAASKKVGFVVAIRVFLMLMPIFRLELTIALAILALATMTLGNVAALTQRSITRLLAYSSIAQAGYILIGLAAAPTSSLGLVGALYHILNHAVMKSAAFIAAAIVIYKLATADLESYKGLGRRMPITAFTLTVSLLALAGAPPMNGFWSKLILFSAAIDGGLWWLALAGVLNSALSLGYYAWIIKRMYLDEEAGGSVSEPKAFTSILIASTIFILLSGIYPAPFYDFITKAAAVMSG